MNRRDIGAITLGLVGLALLGSAAKQISGGASDYGVSLWPWMLAASGALGVVAALSRGTGPIAGATAIDIVLAVYAVSAADGMMTERIQQPLVVIVALLAVVVIWSRAGETPGSGVRSIVAFAGAFGLYAFGLFLVYGGLTYGARPCPDCTDGRWQWLGGGVGLIAVATLLLILGLRTLPSRRAAENARSG